MRHRFVQGGLTRVGNSDFGQRKTAETYDGLSRVTDANMLSKGNVVAEVSDLRRRRSLIVTDLSNNV